MANTIGSRIKHYRKLAGLTQDELSKKVGITRAALCHWEVGRSNPKFEEQQKLASALGCRVSDILGDTPESETMDKIIHLCNKLTEAQRLELINQLEYLVYKNEKEKSTEFARMA